MAVLGALVVGASGLLGLVSGQVPVGAVAQGDFTLTVTPTQNLTTGESMSVDVTRTATGTAADLEITSLGAGWCTADFVSPPNPPGAFSRTSNATLPPMTGPDHHCTTALHPLNSALQLNVGISPTLNATGSDDYPTASGTVTAERSTGTVVGLNKTYTLACNYANVCTFVIAVFTHFADSTTNSPTYFLSVPVTFQAPGAIAGCPATAPGQVSTVAPDRLGPLLTQMTADACEAKVDGGDALNHILSTGQSDASALAYFAGGGADVAYSAVGYNATPTLIPTQQRPYVAVPIAVDAVVLAHVQSKPVPNYAGEVVFAPYPQLRITIAQAAQLLGGGPTGTALNWSGPLGQSLLAENPTLAYPDGYFQQLSSIVNNYTGSTSPGIPATSLPEATTLFATTFFHALAPGSLVNRAGKSLGVTDDFGTVTPPYDVVSKTGGVLLTQAVTPGHGYPFVLTDAAAAASTWGGLADFAIQTPGSLGSTPTYVAPTPASMRAAVSEMIPEPDGTMLPNPDVTDNGGIAPYPLTYVEYAIAPTQPLLNTNCTPRSQSQQHLVDWLRYLTGAGQTELPPGYVSLTSELQAQAQAAIAKVGTAAPTGACASAAGGKTAGGAASGGGSGQGTSNSAQSPAGTGFSASDGLGSASTAGFRGSGSSAPGSAVGESSGGPSGSGSSSPTGLSRGRSLAATALAGFRLQGSGALLPVLALLLLVILLPGLAWIVARGSLTAALGRRRAPPHSEQHAGEVGP